MRLTGAPIIAIAAAGIVIVGTWIVFYQGLTVGIRWLRCRVQEKEDTAARIRRLETEAHEGYVEMRHIVAAVTELGRDLNRRAEHEEMMRTRLAALRARTVEAERELARRPEPHPIIQALRAAGHPLTVAQLSRDTSQEETAVRRQAELLVAAGQVEPYMSREGRAVNWEVIGFQLPEPQPEPEPPPFGDTVETPAVAVNGVRPVLAGHVD